MKKRRTEMRCPNWFDWLVYKVFRWRWNKIFIENEDYRKAYITLFMDWDHAIKNNDLDNLTK